MTNAKYDLAKGLERIQKILATKPIPKERKLTKDLLKQLTFDNGFYVNCIALFVDIRSSSGLTDEHHRPTVAKVYRAFVSEVLQVIKHYSPVHTDIIGDCVSGYFAGDCKSEIDNIFNCAARINSVMLLLNAELRKKGIAEIEVGIGLSYGRILLVQAGIHGNNTHSDNDIVWIGNAVNEASKLSDGRNIIKMSNVFYDNLNHDNKKLCKRGYSPYEEIYQSQAYYTDIDDLIK